MLTIKSNKELFAFVRKNTSFCWYAGPSAINGEDIFALLYFAPSKNPKLGAIPYTTMIPKEGELQSEAVCGNCPFLSSPRSHQRSCYVGYYQLNVFAKWRSQVISGKIPTIDILDKETQSYLATYFEDLLLRHGNSGDPLAVPQEYALAIDSCFSDSISYTHQGYMYTHLEEDKLYSLVSTHSYSHALNLQNQGIRTARVVLSDQSELTEHEIICPHHTQEVFSCDDCRICSSDNKEMPSVVFPAHGARKKVIATFPSIS